MNIAPHAVASAFYAFQFTLAATQQPLDVGLVGHDFEVDAVGFAVDVAGLGDGLFAVDLVAGVQGKFCSRVLFQGM
ncbi:hypothetical protein D3C85_1475900 [compost metagenome]